MDCGFVCLCSALGGWVGAGRRGDVDTGGGRGLERGESGGRTRGRENEGEGRRGLTNGRRHDSEGESGKRGVRGRLRAMGEVSKALMALRRDEEGRERGRTRRNEAKRKSTKRNETRRNETKQNRAKWGEGRRPVAVNANANERRGRGEGGWVCSMRCKGMGLTETWNANDDGTVSERHTIPPWSPYPARCMNEGESACARLHIDG